MIKYFLTIMFFCFFILSGAVNFLGTPSFCGVGSDSKQGTCLDQIMNDERYQKHVEEELFDHDVWIIEDENDYSKKIKDTNTPYKKKLKSSASTYLKKVALNRAYNEEYAGIFKEVPDYYPSKEYKYFKYAVKTINCGINDNGVGALILRVWEERQFLPPKPYDIEDTPKMKAIRSWLKNNREKLYDPSVPQYVRQYMENIPQELIIEYKKDLEEARSETGSYERHCGDGPTLKVVAKIDKNGEVIKGTEKIYARHPAGPGVYWVLWGSKELDNKVKKIKEVKATKKNISDRKQEEADFKHFYEWWNKEFDWAMERYNARQKELQEYPEEYKYEENQIENTNKEISSQLYKVISSRNSAVSYAKTYCNKRNPNYPNYSSDCANFVSQCTRAGGIPISNPPVINQTFEVVKDNFSKCAKEACMGTRYGSEDWNNEHASQFCVASFLYNTTASEKNYINAVKKNICEPLGVPYIKTNKWWGGSLNYKVKCSDNNKHQATYTCAPRMSTPEWRGVSALTQYMTDKGYWRKCTMKDAEVGDVISFNGISHVAIISKVNNGTYYYCAHTTDRCDEKVPSNVTWYKVNY